MSDLVNIPKQSYFSAQLGSAIDASQTSGIILTDVPDYTPGGETVYLNILDSGGVETISVTGWNSSTNELSGVTRAVATYTGETATAFAHAAGITVVLADDWNYWDDILEAVNSKMDEDGGIATGSFTIPNLTEVERDALTPTNGMLCYNTTSGTFQFYDGGAWADVGTATVNNASETVAGVIEIATNAEMGTGTSTGSTGARLMAPNDQLVKTSSGAGDENKLPVLNSDGQFEIGFLNSANTSTANKIVQGDSSGLIDPSWLETVFGGDGSDGALTVSSGTTNIDLGNAAVVIKQYTSMSITGTGKVTFSNPHTDGTKIILRSQGDVTLTSSEAPMLDASGLGAQNGSSAELGFEVDTNFQAAVGDTGSTTNETGGVAGTQYTSGFNLELYTNSSDKLNSKSIYFFPGAAGSDAGPGTAGPGGGTAGTAGLGGAGGGALYIECGGAWDFTTASGISVAGADGTAGGDATDIIDSNDAATGGGGGGGGKGGTFIALYTELTANSGTVNISSGSGGDGGDGEAASGATYARSGGAGGATSGNTESAGQNGADSTNAAAGSNGTNGAGASGGGIQSATEYLGGTGGTPDTSSGLSIVVKNSYF